jgi:hypothetical protein
MRVSLVNLLIIAGALALVLLLTLVGARISRRRRDVALRRHGAPVLVMPIDDLGSPPRRTPAREIFPVRASPSTVRRIAPEAVATLASNDEEDVILVANEPAADGPAGPVHALQEPVDEGRVFEGNQVRFYRAEEGTLEFLPGRIEIVGGADVGQEIHFLRPVGEEGATITFGRSEGPPLKHIQLIDPTVSRQHARLDFSGGRWHLSNLSQTNPVALNGAPIPHSSPAFTLQEGDRVEMGAVVFVFHER